MLVDDLSSLVLPTAVHLIALLVVVAVAVWRKRDGRARRLRWLLAGLLLWSYLFSTPAVANALIAAIERPYPTVAAPAAGGDPLIVVLSSGLVYASDAGNRVKLDEASWERTAAAVRLWKQIHGQLLFVGEPASDGTTSAAEEMRKAALEFGVPPSSIQLETRSTNTWENLSFIQPLVAARPDAWLVTSALHMRRAMGVARRLGMKLRPFPCDHRAFHLRHWYAWLPSSGGPAMFAEPMHELIGLVYYRLRGFVA